MRIDLRRRPGAAAAVVLVLAMSHPSAAQSPSDPEEQVEPPSALRAQLHLFGAIEWGATDRPDTSNSFALGQLDLFLTATLTERTSLLAEVVLEESTETRVITDLERLQLTFRFNDNLQLSAGRYHTGIGFYNSAFHHGALFETAIGRPRIFLFEDDGGILPIHDVGVMVRGAIPATGSNIHYLFELGNGRPGHDRDIDGEARDENDAKAFNGGIAYRPDRWRGLELGGSWRRDVVPQHGLPSIDERIAALYTVYRTPSTELLAEWLTMSLRPRGGARYRDTAGYVQVSHAWGAIRPYYRYDRIGIDPDTPLIGGAGSYKAHLVGLRVDPAPSIGVKAQYERADTPGHDGGDSIRTQLVFVF